MKSFLMIKKRIPITRVKIGIARILYTLVRSIYGKKTKNMVVKRNGITYALDLSEGIDLSVFLFGTFQKHITRSSLISIPHDATILDIGGNFGVMALQFAQMSPAGRVFSFEPTHYAVTKFRQNCALNPTLGERITLMQSFVSDCASEDASLKAFSSWKVDGAAGEKHPVHRGSQKSTQGIGAITLDSFCHRTGIDRVDFIKIDTDGHEYQVLNGARKCIGAFKPQIIFEVGGYVMEEQGIEFSSYLDFFDSLGYKLFDAKTTRRILAHNFDTLIPALGTIDILAIP